MLRNLWLKLEMDSLKAAIEALKNTKRLFWANFPKLLQKKTEKLYLHPKELLIWNKGIANKKFIRPRTELSKIGLISIRNFIYESTYLFEKYLEFTANAYPYHQFCCSTAENLGLQENITLLTKTDLYKKNSYLAVKKIFEHAKKRSHRFTMQL